MIKLYEIPKGSRIKANTFDKDGNKLGDFITFHKIDGLYSYCTIDGKKENNICHIASYAELEKKDDYYVLL